MSSSVKGLLEERGPIGTEIRLLADRIGAESRAFTGEEQVRWDKLNADFNRLTSQIEAVRSGERVNEEFGRRPSNTPGLEDTLPRRSKSARKAQAGADEQLRTLAFQAWCRRQHGFELSDTHVRACKASRLNPNKRVLELRLDRRPDASKGEKRAMSAQDPTNGAYTVPEKLKANIEKALKDFNGMRQVADVMRTEDGATMPWPTNNDTANIGELIGENTAVSELNEQFGIVNFQAYKYSSKMVKVPSELMDDSAFDLGAFIFDAIGERIGRAQEQHFTTGSGQTQPQGALTASVLGKTAAGSTALTGDDIIDLIHSVDPAYRRDPSFRLMFHDQILAAIRKLKDGMGRYLFEEGQNGAPDKIKGVQYVINQNMPSTIASGTKSMLAGAFKKFKIRDVKAVRLKRLDERYAEIDQVAFIAFMRSDSKLLNAGTNPIKHLLHP